MIYLKIYMIFLVLINFILFSKFTNFFLFLLFSMLFFNIFMYNYEMFNPFNITILIIFNSVLICLIVNKMLFTNWFSLILFIIMIGGMMILFLYLNSFTTSKIGLLNQHFYFNFEIKLYFFYWLNFIFFMNNFNHKEIFNFNMSNLNFLKMDSNNELLILFMNSYILQTFIMMLSYLLLLMIIISFLCMTKNFSLRNMQ